MPEPTYLAPGVVLQDRYEIADEIGRGGFSIVYRARDRRVGADIALDWGLVDAISVGAQGVAQ